MQVVIDIDNDLYTRLFDNGEDKVMDMRRACVAIRKGTVLPEGHGDLVDRKKLIECGINKGFCDWYDEIKYASPIIKADKESEV